MGGESVDVGGTTLNDGTDVELWVEDDEVISMKIDYTSTHFSLVMYAKEARELGEGLLRAAKALDEKTKQCNHEDFRHVRSVNQRGFDCKCTKCGRDFFLQETKAI